MPQPDFTNDAVREELLALLEYAYYVHEGGNTWSLTQRDQWMARTKAALGFSDEPETLSANCEDCGVPILPEYAYCDQCARTAGEN